VVELTNRYSIDYKIKI